jgi:hypothetical protein
LPDVDHPDTLLVKLGRLAPFDERGGYGQTMTMSRRRLPKLKPLKLSDLAMQVLRVFVQS